jgi:riboflavin kinase/FMN adenylyltransferase
MKIFRSFEEARSIRNPVVTTGSFDGVHIGHKTILNRLNSIAEKYDGESVLITFDPHPRKVLYPATSGRELKLINSLEEKLYLLEKTGLGNVIIIEFTLGFSKITSEAFVRDILHGVLNARVIVVGFNHHFGFNREGDYRQLWSWQDKYSFEAEEIPEQEVHHETVSSSKIRQAISEGFVQRANAYLDHHYLVMGEVEECRDQDASLFHGFGRIRLTDESKLLPPPGIYAISAETPEYSSKGMVIIGIDIGKPADVLVEIFEEGQPDPGRKITCFFHKRISEAVLPIDNMTLQKLTAARKEIQDLIY